jgi:hypothetical protein
MPDSYAYVPTDFFHFSVLSALASFSLVVTLSLGIRRIIGKTRTRWFYIFASLPTALLFSLFALQCIEQVMGAYLRFNGIPGKEAIEVVSSAHSGRSCRVRNEFWLSQREGRGYWCTIDLIATGAYDADAMHGKAGTLIINPPGIKR